MEVRITLKYPDWLRNVAMVAGPVLAIGIAGIALGGPLVTWNGGDTLKATDLNSNFTSLQSQISAAPSLVKPKPFFSWSPVTTSASAVEAFPLEGQQTITFSEAGYYRVTLTSQVIHDTNTSAALVWHLGGTATRLDAFLLESGGKNIEREQNAPDGRMVGSDSLFLSATTGQTLTMNPGLTVTYANGAYHEGSFAYAVEFLGPP